MSSFSVPPLGNLPQWPRVGSLHKAHFPRPLPRDRLQPLPNLPRVDSQVATCAQGVVDTRVASLERDIHFLQQQHKETLDKLHGELDGLKRENKELQYQLIMDPPHNNRKGTSRRANHPNHRAEPEPQEEASQERALCESPHSQQATPSSGTEHSDAISKSTDTTAPSGPEPEPPKEATGGLITSLQPLRIHCSPSQPPRAPTLQECEVIIRQLYNANSLQSQEILRVKAALKDIMLSKKISPETYVMTKAYLADSSRTEENERLPKLQLEPLPKRLEGSRLGLAEREILPSLKQSLAGGVAERQRRLPALHRGRPRRTVL
ncbi:coiled-coil domain-containing protein 74A isoform X2 [Conger conger]|uniref:coiled-coil domain-containing protein 74A isoform X2 n=1 Tax=Conger conger TaxID=82655 RepID=UPI002A5B0B56|nr:coiled-coil domain-containing protein 74A isoform X2 [Conger conger]